MNTEPIGALYIRLEKRAILTIEDRLQFPLDSFWVSEPFIPQGYISLGKFEETELTKRVNSPGKGTIISVGTHTLVIEYQSKGKGIYMHIFPLESIILKEKDVVEKGELLGFTKGPHLKIKCYVKQATPRILNPMKELYLHSHQYNRSNIPNHTPRPLPRRLEY